MTDDSPADAFVAVGDIMLGDSAICVGFGFHSRHPRDATPALEGVTQLLRRGDIVLGNLECLLAPPEPDSTRYRADQMRGDPEYAVALRQSGFTALSVANNHAMQHGRSAFDATVRQLEGARIACVGLLGANGWCASPVIQTTRSGLRVGLLGYSWRPRQYDLSQPPYAEGDVDAVAEDVRRLRAEADTVVVSLHWGEEFLDSPSASEVTAAHRIIDAGASVIVGHHPHVVRPTERYGRGMICYSLGNLITDMIWAPGLRTGAVFSCRLGREDVTDARVTIVRTNDSYRPVPMTASARVIDENISGMPEPQYRAAVAESVASQRLAAYLYAARNVHRYPPVVLAEMGLTTLRNKARGLVSRAARRSTTDHHSSRGRTQSFSEPQGGAAVRPTRTLSILHVVAPADYGGLESVVRALAAGHAARGHSASVAVVLPVANDLHPFIKGLNADGVRALPVIVGARDYRGERRAIRDICLAQSPDVVHTHGFRSDVVDGAVARAEGIAVVSTCHGFIDTDLRGRLYQWLQRRVLRRFDAVIAVSAAIQARLEMSGVPRMKIHLIPNGIARNMSAVPRDEARRILQLPDVPVIGWVGRLSAEKGPDLALEAFARLRHPDAQLLIVGEGREASPLRSRAEALGISERVVWSGAIPDAERLFSAFDVFLLSSRTEGTPMVLLEAMGAGIPIVATRVGGVPEVVDESTARLIDSGDVDGMAAALADVLSEPAGAHRRSARALERVENLYSIDAWLSQHESIYRGVLKTRDEHPDV